MASKGLTATIRVDVQPFLNGQELTAERLNELVSAVNHSSQATNGGVAVAIAGALVVAGSAQKTISRRRLFSFGLLR